MIASPPIETAVETPRPAWVSDEEISVVIPPERLITPTGPGRVGLGGVFGGAADSSHLADLGDDQAEAVGADDPRPVDVGELDHLGDVAARDSLGDDDDQLDPVEDRLEDGVLGEGGGDRDHRAVDRAAVVLDRLGDRVEYRHPVHLAALAAGGDAADDLGAVVEALPGQVDRLAPGDALDDEGDVLVEQN